MWVALWVVYFGEVYIHMVNLVCIVMYVYKWYVYRVCVVSRVCGVCSVVCICVCDV